MHPRDSGNSMLLIKKSHVPGCIDYGHQNVCVVYMGTANPNTKHGGGRQPEVSTHHGGSRESPRRHSFWAETAGPGELLNFP